ncbi:PREDICTED: protein RIK isoform X2 [Lupinus angustifolius]|uniref:protein RIK isoform X2 n=1 Tax=Lupinus angustifolius TaxID=3871 RepID=UPI00092EF8BD|nr:PREDICTED: protein RIK isoform X2 [Lupinus angustifolius]
MTEDSSVRVSSSIESSVSNDASQTRQRKKRKWDQPAESLMPVGMAVPGVLPFSNSIPLGGIAFSGVTPISSALLSVQQHTAAAAAIPKLNPQRIQEELIIAREIVINDAESSVRYKLTKRQTQEEIQRCTGAIVITRGKYRLPNAPNDGEKPLYLHISAGAHIKETAERILVVDRAAAMVEEMLRQGQNSQSISSTSPSALANGLKVLSTCVFLGFEADPSLNIVARIRGPNDQYINHIMNETGSTVIVKGCGSGNNECSNGEDGQQPLHLFLSSNNAKSLEDAKLLAENLLDTISVECGASRVSSCKVFSAVPPPQQVYSVVPPPQQLYSAFPPPQQVYSAPSLPKQIPTAISPPQVYSAVPPPQQLSAEVQSSRLEANTGLTTSSMSSTMVPIPVPPASFVGVPGVTTALIPGQSARYLSSGPNANMIGYTPPLVSGGTSYIGYGGIYPQATPLQQVALALRHSPPIASTVAPTPSALNGESKSTTSSDVEKEKQPSQRRKFQELPVDTKSTTKLNQQLEPPRFNEQSVVRNISTMPAPKKLIQPSSGIPPPPSRAMPPPPPPPKFSAPPEIKVQDKKILPKTKSDAVPDTLVKLMEYGDDDDDVDDGDDDSSKEAVPHTTPTIGIHKPFWAL